MAVEFGTETLTCDAFPLQSLQTMIDAEKDNTNDWQPIPRHMFEMVCPLIYL